MTPESVLLLIVAGLAGWITSRRYGLTALQVAARSETEKLIAAMRDRLAIVERELAEEKARTGVLLAENGHLKARVEALETKLADLMLSRPPRRSRAQQG